MAVVDQNALLRCKDENGNEYLLYPITKLECVDGAEDLVHYDQEQNLTALQKAQFLKNIGGLCAPESARANQFLKVSAVDENGNVTAVETVEVAGGNGGVSSWNDLTDKPFYEETDVWVSMLPSTTYSGFAYNSTYGCYMYDRGTKAAYSLIIGESYRVTWDGISYECVAQDGSSLLPGAVFIGNASAFGFSGNNEPFIAMVVNGYEVYVSLTDTAAGGTHVVAIEEFGDVIHTLSNKYLDFMDGWDDETILPEQQITFVLDSENATVPEESIYMAAYVSVDGVVDATGNITDSSVVAPVFDIVAGREYIVIIDGVAYKVTAEDISSQAPSTVVVNKYVRLSGPSESGFLMEVVDGYDTSSDAHVKGLIIQTYHTPDANTIDLVIGVRQEAGGIIKEEYLPDILPESTTSDSGKVLTVDSAGTAAWQTPTSSSGLPESATADAGKVLTVDSSGAAVWETPASGLPEVTTADAGKFLRVSADGSWTVESIPTWSGGSY